MRNAFTLIILIFLSACAQNTHPPALTELEYKALDFIDAGGDERWWGDTAPPNLIEAVKEEADNIKKLHPNTKGKVIEQNLLALSGGGANGSFGAGLLAGWTKSGKRPEFDIVTGSSTGAIIAPFAFLGAEYDNDLLSIYKLITRDNIYTPKILTGLISGSSVLDTTSLKKQIEIYVTPELVKEIATEHRKGRRLFMVTTHFNAMRPMIWNIGYIANEHPSGGIDLIRQVILASASIPVLFPPVEIKWEIDGKEFTEIHVDGAITRSVFAYPAKVNIKEIDKAQGLKFNRNVYVILNGNSELSYDPDPSGVLGIAERTTYALLRNQANADIERIYYLSNRDDINFNMIEIPDTFIADGGTGFDPIYMNKLLELGEDIGKKGNFWYKKPISER